MSKRYYDAPIICTYSGGKDSDVLLDLFIRSGVEFEAHNSHTTVDAPDTVYYIREKFRGLKGNPMYYPYAATEHVAVDCQKEDAAHQDAALLL